MDLSPNDVRNYEFPSQMRGYDKESVNEFLEQVASALEAAKQENLKLSMEIDSLKSQLSGLKQFEETIKNAAIDARRNADMTVANAKQEAELILNKARSEAEKELASRSGKAQEIEEQITKLQLAKKSYYSKIHNLIKSHLDLIGEIGEGGSVRPPIEDRIEVTDSAEVDAKRRETIATPPSKTGGIRTEEVASDESGDDALSDSGKQMLEAAIKGGESDTDAETTQAPAPEAVAKPPKPSETPGIDPELAAALENYQNAAKKQQEQENAAAAAPPPPPASGIVETDSRAEDVPEGFVTSSQEKLMEQASADTGPVGGRPKPAITPAAQDRKPVGPENIADELDQVVAKFEEEMDRAAKS